MTHKYYNVCIATTGKDDKTYFTKVGAAFPGKDGSKAIMNIKLDAHSLNGEYVLFASRACNALSASGTQNQNRQR